MFMLKSTHYHRIMELFHKKRAQIAVRDSLLEHAYTLIPDIKTRHEFSKHVDNEIGGLSNLGLSMIMGEATKVIKSQKDSNEKAIHGNS